MIETVSLWRHMEAYALHTMYYGHLDHFEMTKISNFTTLFFDTVVTIRAVAL